MFDTRIAATAIVAISIGGAAHGASEANACLSGELTNERLASETCLDRIPVPALRPGQNAVSTAAEDEQPVEVEYIETPGLNAGETRTVRLVGPRFLPSGDDESQIRQTMKGTPANGWDRVVHFAASWLGMTPEQIENRRTAAADDEPHALDMAATDSKTFSTAN